MNFDCLALKPQQDQPDYITSSQLLRLQRAGILRLDRASNTLVLSQAVFAYQQQLVHHAMGSLPGAQLLGLKHSTDSEVLAFLTSLRTVKALPAAFVQPFSLEDCTFESHLASRSDLRQEIIVAQEQFFDREWFAGLVANLGLPGHVIATHNGYKLVATDFPDYKQPEYDNTEYQAQDEEHLVETPNAHTIQELADFLHVQKKQAIKAVFYQFQQRLVFICIRGDLDVDEEKLFSVLGGSATPASAELITKHGLVPGYAGWHAVKQEKGIIRLLDASLQGHRNAVTGANKENFHLLGYDLYKYIKEPKFVDVAVTGSRFNGSCYFEFSKLAQQFELIGQSKIACNAGILTFHFLELLAVDDTYRRDEDYVAVLAKEIDVSKLHGVFDQRPKVSLSAKKDIAKLGLFRRFIVLGRDFLNSGEAEVYEGDFETAKRVSFQLWHAQE